MTIALSADEAIRVSTSLVVTAGAGTGKTELLTQRYLYHLEQGLSPLSIVAVTFTERAAAELRRRIRDRAGSTFHSRPDLVAEIDAAPIGTIHGIAARICREHPEEAGVPADFRILDQIDDALWSDEQLSLALDGLPQSFFAVVPYNLARAALEACLNDPLVAERALARGSDDWPKLAATRRRDALEELLESPAWRRADATLSGLVGTSSDLLEGQRRIAIEALAALGRDVFPREPLETIEKLKVNVGRAANWPGGRLNEVKEAIKVVRDAAKEALKAGLVTLDLGPADEGLRELLPSLHEAFEQVMRHFDAAKRRARGLTFADLEAHAPLVQTMNEIGEAVLAGGHQNLNATRLTPPHLGPHLHAYAVDKDGSTSSVEQRRWVEARHVAVILKDLINTETRVHDKSTDELRPLRAGDIAILARTWDTLDKYGDALEAERIPTVLVGGGSLLDTREAKDGVALLRFLGDPTDDIALVAILRGPFFAISDKILFHVARSMGRGTSWWETLEEVSVPEVGAARSILGDLLAARQREPPSRLLLGAARRCGYTAIIANLANAPRREADWTGFISFIRGLERGNNDVFTIARQLKRLIDAKVEVPRPPLQAGNAIALLTIHGAKGLEWPVVVLPDLGRQHQNDAPRVLLDPELGVALQLKDDEGQAMKPMLYTLLREQARRREAAEAGRVLYVALTRARDRVILTSSDPFKSDDRDLGQGLDNAGVSVIPVAFDWSQSIPPTPRDPVFPAEPGRYLIGPINVGLANILVAAGE